MKIANHIKTAPDLMLPEENFGVDILPLTSQDKISYGMRLGHSLLGVSLSITLMLWGSGSLMKPFSELTRVDILPSLSFFAGVVSFAVYLVKLGFDLAEWPNSYTIAARKINGKRLAWEQQNLIPYLNNKYGIEVLSLSLKQGKGIARDVNNSYPYSHIEGSKNMQFRFHIDGVTYMEDKRFTSKYRNIAPFLINLDMDNLRIKTPAPQEFIVLQKS